MEEDILSGTFEMFWPNLEKNLTKVIEDAKISKERITNDKRSKCKKISGFDCIKEYKRLQEKIKKYESGENDRKNRIFENFTAASSEMQKVLKESI